MECFRHQDMMQVHVLQVMDTYMSLEDVNREVEVVQWRMSIELRGRI